MQTIEIKKTQFLKDKKEMTVKAIMEKYGLNTAQYYKVLDQLGIKRVKRSESKKVKVVD